LFILILLCLDVYLFIYARVYFLYINIFFVIFYLFSYLNLYIYIYIFNYINYIFIQNSEENSPNKSTKLGARWKNLFMLNDFKEKDKIVFEIEVNIPDESRVLCLHDELFFVTFLIISVNLFKLDQFVYLRLLFMYMHCLH